VRQGNGEARVKVTGKHKARKHDLGELFRPAFRPRSERRFDLRFALAFLLGPDDVGEPQAVAALRGEVAVVAAVQVQGLNVQRESAVGDGLMCPGFCGVGCLEWSCSDH